MRRLFATVLATSIAVLPAPAAARGTVIGYIAAFEGFDGQMARPRLDLYTHLIVAFINPTPSGTVSGATALACAPAGGGTMISQSQLRDLVASAHRSGSKVLASLGGAIIPPCGGDWRQLLQPQARDALVANLIQLVQEYNLDGLDIDLEGKLMTSIDEEGNYTPFVKELAEALHASSKLLTAATGSYSGGMLPDASLPYFDLISVMSYDAVGPSWGIAGGEHSPYAQARADLALWIGKGVPASKLALGLPFYGRGFGSYRELWSLDDIASSFGNAQLNSDVVGQRCGGCSYISYNGLPTLERKAELAGAWGVGVMVWEVGQDLADRRAIERVIYAYRRGRSFARNRGATR